MSIIVVKSHHQPDLHKLVGQAWASNALLLIIPPHIKNFSFFRFVPAGEIDFYGDWSKEDQALIQSISRIQNYDKQPVLGLMTSGTSLGVPQMVLYTKENILGSLERLLSVFDQNRIDHIFCYPQPFHIFGFLLGYILPYLKKWKVSAPVGKYAQDSHRLWQETVTAKTLTLGTPTQLRDLCDAVEAANAEPIRSYSCIMGGAPVSVGLWTRVQKTLQIENPSIGYGSTEACLGLTHLPPGQAPQEEGEIGYPLPGVKLELLGDHTVQFEAQKTCLAIFNAHEIYFPKHVVLRDDLRPRKDGAYIFCGRTDLVANRGGMKISLEHIEQVLNTALGIRAQALALKDERLGEDIGLLLEGSQHSEAAVLATLQQHLGLNLKSQNLRFTRQLPLNENAKLNRQAAKLNWQQGSAL